MITFQVDSVRAVAPNASSPHKWHDHYFKQELAVVGMGQVEARKFNAERDFELLRPNVNSFLETCISAYDEHVPLTLGPDDVWIVICQAVAKHIELNPEEVRHALVNFEGKKELHVIANHLHKGSPDNDWHSVFAGFGDQIEKHLGKKRDLFDPTFTTTTPIEKAAIQVQMMAALAPFFDYSAHTCCGIPNVTLLGDVADWKAITERVIAFGEFYPKWAHDPLMYAVSEFLTAASGEPNPEFWKNFVKRSGGSGGPYVSGFINAFFPYLNSKPNRVMNDPKAGFIEKVRNSSWGGPTQSSFPGSITSVPMKWHYYDQLFNMTLAAGIFGTTVHGAGYRPAIGWVVGEAREQPSKEEVKATRLAAWKDGHG